MSASAVETRTLLKIRDGRSDAAAEDWVVVEEPLEIRVGGETLAVVMRTPGDDLELVAGFALTEGVVSEPRGLGTIRRCPEAKDGGENAVDITLAPGFTFDSERLRRALVANAACGLCGRASLEALAARARPSASKLRIPHAVVLDLPRRLAETQGVFRRTGALHAAALFHAAGTLVVAREDVGRHNAVDKVIGRAIFDDLPLADRVLLVSGRTSFEILQKAAVAGIPMVAAVSGPTTLAIETARAFNITLVNFLRPGGMNVASAPERITGL
ncbi:MAG TPA: formate dehydrogenase accessory sulfurtransferase FdhD [Candidatus Polarisedimenticolia bacterium]|nr:formate dehydrogenase accessory sulfurtransferase FdhD [Candidatus Polarisedimenticolia bacterium]